MSDTKAEAQFNELSGRRSESFTWTPEEEKQLVKKIDLFLLPTIWLMYLLSYMWATLTLTLTLMANQTQGSYKHRQRKNSRYG